MTVNIGILGADGRMGVAVIRALAQTADARLSAALTAPHAAALGQDAGSLANLGPLGVSLTSDISAGLNACDVLIDFSAPTAALKAAQAMSGSRCRAMVSGTTGFSEAEHDAMDAASSDIALLRSGNFSPGVTALAALVEIAAEKLGAGWDIEILEMHHRHKVDAPSGTALLLGEAAARGRKVSLDDAAVTARGGVTDERRDGEIGFASLRGGGVIGQHEVRLAAPLEMITLGHEAFDRSVFAQGAVDAALWLHKNPNGLYSMRDVLGF